MRNSHGLTLSFNTGDHFHTRVLQPCKFLVDTVFAKGMTVRQSKEELLPLLKEQCKLDLNIDRQVETFPHVKDHV